MKRIPQMLTAAVTFSAALAVLAAPAQVLAQQPASPKAPASKLATLTVALRGLKSGHSKVVLALFSSSAGFPQKTRQALRRASTSIKGGRARVVLRQLPPGTYAVAAYHDENGNGKLDTTWTGRPKEGIGMSNDARGHRGPPKFKDARFKLKRGASTIRIAIRY